MWSTVLHLGTSASERKDVCKESLRLFGNIMSKFLKHISHPERVSWLVKVRHWIYTKLKVRWGFEMFVYLRNNFSLNYR